MQAGGFIDGAATLAQFNRPRDLVLSADGNFLFVADEKNTAVRSVRLSDGSVSTFKYVPIEPRTISLTENGYILLDGFDGVIGGSVAQSFELVVVNVETLAVTEVTSFKGLFGMHGKIVPQEDRVMLARNW